MEKLQVPAWILAIALSLVSIGFIVSAFIIKVPFMFAGLEFGAKAQDWPVGRYGLLADGACPKGFSQVSASLLAVSLYSNDARYVQPAMLGSSWVGLHNKGNSGNLGDVSIVACFKNDSPTSR